MRWTKFVVILLSFGVVLGAEYLQSTPIGWDWLRHCRDDLVVLLNARDVQQAEILCLGAYLVVLMITLRPRGQHSKTDVVRFGLTCHALRFAFLSIICGMALLKFFLGPSNGTGCTDPVVLFIGLLLGKSFALFKRSQRDAKVLQVQEDISNALVILLTLSVLVQPDWWHGSQYSGQRRWQGIWRNPNSFGLLMATGLVLASAMALQRLVWKSAGPTQDRFPTRHTPLLGYSLAAVLMTVGLIRSYSRGAWLATLFAVSYLILKAFRLLDLRKQIRDGSVNQLYRTVAPASGRLTSNCVAAAVIVVSVTTFAFWELRGTEMRVFRRIFSVVNVNDFSWRNRLATYEGALQMISAKPWFGFGWDQPKMIYEESYKPTRLEEGKAIELNDYFVVGMTLGLPALACLVGYLWFSLRQKFNIQNLESGCTADAWRNVTCRAGAIVLLIGFLLERGLFCVALGIPFWILLESAGSEVGDDES